MSEAKIFTDNVSTVFFCYESSDGGCHQENEVIDRKFQTKTAYAKISHAPAYVQSISHTWWVWVLFQILKAQKSILILATSSCKIPIYLTFFLCMKSYNSKLVITFPTFIFSKNTNGLYCMRATVHLSPSVLAHLFYKITLQMWISDH